MATVAMTSIFLVGACGSETSASGVQAQPGVYPILLIGLFLIIGGAVATWAMYRKADKTKTDARQSGKAKPSGRTHDVDVGADDIRSTDRPDNDMSK